MSIEQRIKNELKKILAEMVDQEFEQLVRELFPNGEIPKGDYNVSEALKRESRYDSTEERLDAKEESQL